MKKFFVLSILLTTIIILSGCSKFGSQTKKANFETQVIELDNCKFEVPSSWVRIEDPTISSSLYIFAPADANLSKNSSNVALTTVVTPEKAPDIKELQAESAAFEKQIKNIFKDAKDFKFGDFTVPSGKVFTLEYTVVFGDITMIQTQYYILMDNMTVVITATDIGDGVTPTPVEVIKHMANSFQLKK